MSTHFTPTTGIKDTARNVDDFIHENMYVFWQVFKPLIPYLFGLLLLDTLISMLLGPDPVTGDLREIPIGGIISGYFMTCLVISWHRVVIHGPKEYIPMNPLKPQKSEWAFIGMGVLIFMVPLVIGAIMGGTAAAAGKPILLFLLIPFFIAAIYISMKIIFYFPSKATGNTITLKQSFAMTKGYVWKLIAANFLAALKTILIMIAYMIVGMLVLIGLGAAMYSIIDTTVGNIIATLLGLLYALPIAFYFQPLLTIIGVTVLSNYYQHAMQNKGTPENT